MPSSCRSEAQVGGAAHRLIRCSDGQGPECGVVPCMAGLVAGVGLAIKTLRPECKVIGVEPKNCRSFEVRRTTTRRRLSHHSFTGWAGEQGGGSSGRVLCAGVAGGAEARPARDGRGVQHARRRPGSAHGKESSNRPAAAGLGWVPDAVAAACLVVAGGPDGLRGGSALHRRRRERGREDDRPRHAPTAREREVSTATAAARGPKKGHKSPGAGRIQYKGSWGSGAPGLCLSRRVRMAPRATEQAGSS